MLDKMKTINQLRKIQKELKKTNIEVEAGDGAVKLTINGEQKIQNVVLDHGKIDKDNYSQLEKWLESAFNQAITKSQQEAADKMKSIAGGLGLPGL